MDDLEKLKRLRIDPSAKTARRLKKRIPVWAWAILSLIGAGFGVFFIMGRAVVRVEVAPARSLESLGRAAVLNASGYVTARRRATVASKITGRIREMLVEEGMAVQKGQILARLDDSDARAQYASAKADRDVARSAITELVVGLKDAERDLARAGMLRADGVVDQQTLDKAQAAVDSYKARLVSADSQVRSARAKMRVARQEMRNCVIRSPFAGIAISKDAEAGEIVSPMSAGGGYTRTGISTIVDMSSLEIEVDVNESYISRVRIGQEVTAALDAHPDWEIPCTVRAVIPAADRQKATVKVRIAFDQLDPRILPDMGVKVSFLREEIEEQRSPVKCLVPRSAVRNAGAKTVVYVVKDSKVEIRGVTAGKTSGDDIEIFAGVIGGELVVVATPMPLEDGQKVHVKGVNHDTRRRS